MRNSDGRYLVAIPVDPAKIIELGDTRESVLRLFFAMERRLVRNPEWHQKYIDFMEADGHMQKAVQVDAQYRTRVYIPHHALPADRKFRVVFNGSHTSRSGVSFNEAQYTGPRL